MESVDCSGIIGLQWNHWIVVESVDRSGIIGGRTKYTVKREIFG